MSCFYFKVRDGADGIADDEGVELADAAAAKAYAIDVAREVMKGDEVKKRPWLLEVRDQEGAIVVEVRFAAVDPTLDHLDADLRVLVERMAEDRRRIQETLHVSSCLVALGVGSTRSVRKPYLIAVDGQRL
jgi:hypothetical protein